jgi:Zn-dependent peptidase ImmA (M78 family)/DNA-binding XRE family transcriptional regulator
MNHIVAYRIKNGRLLKGYSQNKLAEELHISKQMISKYENGLAIPDSKKLIALSKLFGVKVDYFFNSYKVGIERVNFRKKAKFSKKKQDSLRAKIKSELENYLWIEDLLSIDYSFKNPISKIEIKSLNDIEDAVFKLRNEWNIGTDPLHNCIQLLEDQEIKIIEIDSVDDSFDGLATFADDKYPVIVVNKNFPVERKRFTLLHELGHLLLNLKNYDYKNEEMFCNKFASEFLYPKNIVKNDFGGKRDGISLNELIAVQKKYGISIPAIVYKLVDANILAKDKIKQFYKRMNSNKNFKNTVNENRFETPESANRFERLVYRALTQDSISTSKASSLLGVNLSEVKDNFALI